MRLLLKLLLFIIFGPLVLGILAVLAIVAIVGAPILWEQLVARFSAPPNSGTPPAQ